MKNRDKLFISIIAVVFSISAAAIGYGLTGETAAAFPIRFLYGFVFSMTPMSVIWLVILLFQKR